MPPNSEPVDGDLDSEDCFRLCALGGLRTAEEPSVHQGRSAEDAVFT